MITPIEANDIPKKTRNVKSEKLDSIVNDLREFVDGGYEVCAITDPGYKTTNNFYHMVLYAIKKHGFNVTPMRRGERLFLIRGGGDD